MTLALVLAIAGAFGAAMLVGPQQAPPTDEKSEAAREKPPSAPTPTPAPEPAGPRPKTLDECIARRATRDIQPDGQVARIADLYVDEIPKVALGMIRALVTDTLRIQKPEERAKALARLGAALAKLGEVEEAEGVLSQAVRTAEQATANPKGRDEALLLCAVGYAHAKNSKRATELASGGRALAEVTVALAESGATKEAQSVLKKAALEMEKAPRHHRFSYLRALAKVGDLPAAQKQADAFDGPGDQALAYAQLAGALDSKRQAVQKKKAIATARARLGEAEVKWERRAALLLELADSSHDAADEVSAAELRNEALGLGRAHKDKMVGGAIMAQVAGSMAESGKPDEAKKVLEELEGSPLVGVVALPMTQARVQSLAGDHIAALDTISMKMTTWSAFAYARVVVSATKRPGKKAPAEWLTVIEQHACKGL